MGNKGQTLVLFVLLIPIIFILLGFIIDIGFLYSEKIKINSSVKTSLTSVLTESDQHNIEGKFRNIITKNLKNIKIEKCKYENDILYVTISKDYQTIFSKIFKSKKYNIKVSYKAYIENEEIKIKKE